MKFGDRAGFWGDLFKFSFTSKLVGTAIEAYASQEEREPTLEDVEILAEFVRNSDFSSFSNYFSAMRPSSSNADIANWYATFRRTLNL